MLLKRSSLIPSTLTQQFFVQINVSKHEHASSNFVSYPSQFHFFIGLIFSA